MQYFVYFLLSIKNSKIKSYIGYTINLKHRLKLHNEGRGAKSTRGYKWKVIYSRKYSSKSKAMSEEYMLKNNKKKRKSIITKYLSTNQL